MLMIMFSLRNKHSLDDTKRRWKQASASFNRPFNTLLNIMLFSNENYTLNQAYSISSRKERKNCKDSAWKWTPSCALIQVDWNMKLSKKLNLQNCNILEHAKWCSALSSNETHLALLIPFFKISWELSSNFKYFLFFWWRSKRHAQHA